MHVAACRGTAPLPRAADAAHTAAAAAAAFDWRLAYPTGMLPSVGQQSPSTVTAGMATHEQVTLALLREAPLLVVRVQLRLLQALRPCENSARQRGGGVFSNTT